MNELTKVAIYYIEKWFNLKLYPSQKHIADFFFNNKRKATIKACTRYGKSQTIAVCAIMYAIFFPNKRIGIIAPTNDKTKIIMNYIQTALASCKEMENAVDLDLMELSKLERIKREVSKRKITFKNGSSIEVLSPDIKGKGFAAMGRAYDLNIIDETAEIPDEVYSKIYRMLVENDNAKLIEIGNPWHLNHFFEHHNAEDWEKFTINWQTAVAEGRMTNEAIEDQRRNITELEFEVLYNAEFPQDGAYTIFKMADINKACIKKDLPENVNYLVGIDVASGGVDFTVIVVIAESNGEFYFVDYKKIDKSDLMAIVEEIRYFIDKYPNPKIQVDAIGIGKGVSDRLHQLGYVCYPYIAGNKAIEKNRFVMRKTEDLFGLSDIMRQGRFFNLPANSPFVLEMRRELFEVARDKLLSHIDPEDKSPDFLDATNICMARERGKVQAFTLDI